MDFQQSQTYKNLLNAYQNELTTCTYYLLNADKARLEGYIEIGNIFDATAKNEKEHARIWQRQLNYKALPNTEQNLLDSAEREIATGKLYRQYAQTATNEGYPDIAALFNGVANIELNHNLRFKPQYDNIILNEEFCKPVETLWICIQCGNIMSSNCAPDICPVCGFPQGYYKIFFDDVGY